MILIDQLTFHNGNGHQDEEAYIILKGVERRDNGSALFHVILFIFA